MRCHFFTKFWWQYHKQKLLYRRVLRGRLGHAFEIFFHLRRYLFNQIHCFRLVHCGTQLLLSNDWLISGMIFLLSLTVVFLPNNCLFIPAFIMSSRITYKSKKWPEFSEDLRKKSPRNAFKTLLSLAGSWIGTVHTMLNTVFFIFFRNFLFEKDLEWSFWSVD